MRGWPGVGPCCGAQGGAALRFLVLLRPLALLSLFSGPQRLAVSRAAAKPRRPIVAPAVKATLVVSAHDTYRSCQRSQRSPASGPVGTARPCAPAAASARLRCRNIARPREDEEAAVVGIVGVAVAGGGGGLDDVLGSWIAPAGKTGCPAARAGAAGSDPQDIVPVNLEGEELPCRL
mmetsp:Transcript_36386/g.87042  ORF Transcript_36386/g.87042 Transcript_36386/m.87042 type:complete len:177 (+) Transcript_36386:319-849(+)